MQRNLDKVLAELGLLLTADPGLEDLQARLKSTQKFKTQIHPKVQNLADSGRRLVADFAEGAREDALEAAGEFSTVLSGEEVREAFGVEDSDPPAEAALDFEDAFEFPDFADVSDFADDALELVFESLPLSSFSPGTLRDSFSLRDALDFAEELLEEALEAVSVLAEVSPRGVCFPVGEGDLETVLLDFPETADFADLADEALEDF